MNHAFTPLLLLLGAWTGAGTAQAQVSDTVVVWGRNSEGQTTVPVMAQHGMTAIAGGQFHTVALMNDGSVVAWGWNGDGQMTAPVVAQSGVTAIAAGHDHTVALKNDGSVVAWGNNSRGQTTVPSAAQSGVTAIAAGGYHTVALKSDGSVVAWGWNGYGQITVPVAAQSGVMAIAARGSHTVALKQDGRVLAWGRNNHGQTTVPVAAQSGVTEIAAGGDADGAGHTVALKSDGSVVAWGDNGHGQTAVPAGLSGVTAIAAGSGHTVALKNDRTVLAWGNNQNGQTLVPVPAQGRVTTIAAGGEHTMALVIPTAPLISTQPVNQAVNVGQSATFTVTATGYPLYYQWRQDGVNVVREAGSTYYLQFAQTNQAGRYTVLVSNGAGSVTSAPPATLTVDAFTAPATVVAWGANYLGQTSVPAGLSGVIAIAAGGAHTVALKSDGSVVAWGYYNSGATTVPVAAQSGVTAIAAGAYHTVALKNDGSVVAWGAESCCDDHGQTTVPAGLSGVTAIAAGDYHTVALKTNGSVVAWGANGQDYGQTTVPVAAQSGVTAIAAGAYHTVALKNDGSVVAWGLNGDGQTTVPVAARSEVTAIAAGAFHTVALKNDGSVVAWGSNGYGQSTVPLAAQSGVAAIEAGTFHTVALKNDGSVVAWGSAAYGQTTVPTHLGGVTAIAAGADHTVALLSPTRIQLTAADLAMTENGGAVSLTVERLGVLSGTHTIDYATQDGSAVAGFDYTAQSGTLTFAPGQTTRTVSIAVLNDGVPEEAETFQVLLSNLTGTQARIGAPATTTVTLLDNDTGIQFSAAHYSVWETGGVATITVLRGDDLNRVVTVDYAFRDTTATAGADHLARSGTLQFAAGETARTIPIPLLDDGLDEGAETLHLTLANPSAGVSLGAIRDVDLAILDDERPLRFGGGQLKTIAAGGSHTLALKADGSLWAWGSGSSGQLGDGTNQAFRTIPVRVGTDTDWMAVDAGDLHSVGLKADGSLWSWGGNDSGRLGDGTTTDRHRPVRVGTDNDWAALSAGESGTLALKMDGSLWAWGSGRSPTGPVRVGTDNDWAALADERCSTATVKQDGSLWLIWGFGSPLPAEHVGTDHDWFTVAAGGDDCWDSMGHTLALKLDGTLFAWGDNSSGQSGNGTNDPVTKILTPIGLDNDWAAIAAGAFHSAALKQDGSLWTWGAGWNGQLGNGTRFDTNRPVRIGSDNDWSVVDAGFSHTVALKIDGSLWAWGGTEDTTVPVRIGTDNDWALPALPGSAFRITSQGVGADGRFRIAFTTTNSFSYFILLRSTDLAHIQEPVDATLGPFVFQLSDSTPVAANTTAFYRLRAVPLAQPLDSDGDGIDDGYELRHRGFLSPFNPADAVLDFDNDGRTNFQEYRDGTDPTTPP